MTRTDRTRSRSAHDELGALADLRVAPDVRRDERARHEDALTAAARGLERGASEGGPDTVPLERRIHLRVDEHDPAAVQPVAEGPGELAAEPRLPPVLLRVVELTLLGLSKSQPWL